MFNTHYINILEKKLGVPTENYVIDTNNTQEIIERIIRKCERHPGILKIKNNLDSSVFLISPKLKLQTLMHFLNRP